MLLSTKNVLTLPCDHQNLEAKILSSVSSQAGIHSHLRLIPSIGIQFRSQLRLVSSVDRICLNNEAKKRRIRGKHARLLVSSYDTASVAMVPCKELRGKPLFPKSLEWVMENQLPDGSWCPNLWRPILLVKESLSSTLACVLALHKWKLGHSLVKKGLKFIEASCSAAIDEKQLAPIGFDIIFLAMIELAIESGLKLSLDPNVLDVLWQKRDTEVARCDLEGTKSYLAYLLEGIGKKSELKDMINHQKINGSFYISPSATAAALFYNHNDQCYNYLTSVLKKLENSEIYIQLCVIDNLEKLGLDRYCRSEIESILDNIYRCWLRRDEEIVLDTICCAMGFRLLRMNAYDVSSEALAQFSEEEHFFNSVNPQFTNTNTILELFKASKIKIYQKEDILEKLEAWTGSFLKHQLLNGAIEDQKLREEVDHFLKYRYDSLDFLESRWTIEQQKTNTAQTSIRILTHNNGDILALAIQEYNMCQSFYQEEYKYLERWVKDCRFDDLKFARVLLLSCYFPTTAILVAPQLADARLSITKSCILTTVIDDFFDVGGSKEEMENLIQLIERWGETSSVGYCSERVEILFSALEDMIKEVDAIAFKHHGRSVEQHCIKIWHDSLKSMMKEAEWAQENRTPLLDEYIENAYISFALGPVCLITTYFLGITLPEELMAGPEIYNLFKHASLVGRLLNDLTSFKREREQGKHNSISLRVLHSEGTMTEEVAIEETKRDIDKYRNELLRVVVQKEESSLPKPIRDFFWKFCNILHYFYMENDGYSNPKLKMANDAKAVLWEPITSSF